MFQILVVEDNKKRTRENSPTDPVFERGIIKIDFIMK